RRYQLAPHPGTLHTAITSFPLTPTFGNRTSIKFARRGINVIKLYAGNPDLNAGAPGTAGNWKAFRSYCYNGGNKPVYVVMFSYTQGGVIAGRDRSQYLHQAVRRTREEHDQTSGSLWLPGRERNLRWRDTKSTVLDKLWDTNQRSAGRRD